MESKPFLMLKPDGGIAKDEKAVREIKRQDTSDLSSRLRPDRF